MNLKELEVMLIAIQKDVEYLKIEVKKRNEELEAISQTVSDTNDSI